LVQAIKEFQESDGFRAVADGARSMAGARRSLHLKLPENLGGRREIDVSQMRWLRGRLLADFDARTYFAPNFAGSDITWVVGNQAGEEEAMRCRVLVDAMRHQHGETRKALEKMLGEMIAALEKAPGEK
jgi:hypothetical protein